MSPAGFSNDGERHVSALPRRSIWIVPALTGRSADYWIYGQSALLSAGVTTVFCTGVGPKLSGGSCFIGRRSWEHGEGLLACHHNHITPYAGWSRGIYYNNPNDALGKEEQALVIVDLDPIYMTEGKPRPQVLPVPLQLVAHLPVIESLDSKKTAAKKRQWTDCTVGITSKEIKLPAPLVETEKVKNVIAKMDLTDKKVEEEVSKLGEFFSGAKKDDVFGSRLKHWIRNGRDMPSTEPAPAFVDWLWVDLTPNEGAPADIYVPPWTSDPIQKKAD
jgi:hypothetical protein